MIKKIFVIFKVVVIVHLIVCLVNGWWAATFVCLFNLVLLFVSDFIQKKLGYNDILYLFIYIFLTGSLLGGEVYYLYVKVWYFDIIMHTLSSFIVSYLLYYIVKYFNVRINIPLFITFIFSFAMMVASLWEITEFIIDRVLVSDMQKDTIITEVKSKLLSSDGKSVIKKKINSMKIDNIIVDGYVDIGLYDTMEDMICAAAGSILFIIIIKLKEAF